MRKKDEYMIQENSILHFDKKNKVEPSGYFMPKIYDRKEMEDTVKNIQDGIAYTVLKKYNGMLGGPKWFAVKENLCK